MLCNYNIKQNVQNFNIKNVGIVSESRFSVIQLKTSILGRGDFAPPKSVFSHTVKEQLVLYYDSLIGKLQRGINWIPKNSENRMQKKPNNIRCCNVF